MEWTAEQDAQLTELHRKRLSVRFIADWMRWPAAEVRARLATLGLTKPLSTRGASVVTRAARPERPAAAAHRAEPVVLALDNDDDEDEDMRRRPGCPRGHLVPEAKIAALYSALGCDYR